MNREELLHLCSLARLDLPEAELEAFETKFSSMLGFVQTMLAYEPQGEGPPLTMIEKLELRPDQPVDFEWHDRTGHEYRVPRIINFEGGDE